MFESLNELRKILYFHDWDTLISLSGFCISIIALVFAIIGGRKWLEQEKFREKLKLLEKLEKHIKKYSSFLEKDYLFAEKDKNKLDELKTDLKYIILDFECLLKNEKWKNVLKDHSNDIQKLNNGYNAFSLSIEKTLTKEENSSKEDQKAKEYFNILIKELEQLYKELKKEVWLNN